ncbi:alpha-amylase family glycosyl hydrolase [Nitratireductor thuwali]
MWWKNAVIYTVDVERFCDSNGDGIGDFKGLTSKLSHVAELGATCIWLLPFFPSLGRDNGYDVTDYLRVDSRYGVFSDFLEFVHRAGEHGIRIIVDLVVHHTSDQHPWFQAARNNEESRYRDYYVWTHNPPPIKPGQGTMFPGEEKSVWTYDEVARAYYHHRFYHFEPGLNHANPQVRDEIERIFDYWISFGISGFRIDAASHILEDPLVEDQAAAGEPDVLRELYRRAKSIRPDLVLLGEVDEAPEELEKFFDGTRLNMMFNFMLDNYLILALAQQRSEPVERGLTLLPIPPENGQWANFLRNLDEADLERLTPMKSKPSSRSSRRKSACASMGAVYGAESPRCSRVTHAGSRWPTACCSPCRVRRWSSMATRSAWAMTWRNRAVVPSARRCSGPPAAMPAFRKRRPASSCSR